MSEGGIYKMKDGRLLYGSGKEVKPLSGGDGKQSESAPTEKTSSSPSQLTGWFGLAYGMGVLPSQPSPELRAIAEKAKESYKVARANWVDSEFQFDAIITRALQEWAAIEAKPWYDAWKRADAAIATLWRQLEEELMKRRQAEANELRQAKFREQAEADREGLIGEIDKLKWKYQHRNLLVADFDHAIDAARKKP